MSSPWRSGGWRLRGPRELFELARPALEEAARARRSECDPRPLGPHQAFHKGSPLAARPALRHALRGLGGLDLPRLAEFANLSWLAENGFLAARPLLAGAWAPGGLPRYQFLFTELVPEASTLAEAYPHATPAQRRVWLVALARDVARMHRLGFVHRDLFPRNLLSPRSGQERCVFLDAWRGGPGPGLRGPTFDLGCLFLDGASLFTPAEQSLFLASYREELSRLGGRLGRNWPRRVERARFLVYRREVRRRSGLVPAWSFPLSNS